ncbi:MAG: AAA family ATPase [Tannerella sp.]|nr:AAA family ATPase [Tannerella sp.]
MPRAVKLEKQSNYVFVGLRWAEKTYLMYQRIRELLNEGMYIREILYINFEDERLSEIRLGDLSVLLECYREMFDHRPVVFLDEIQLIEGWEKFVHRLADTEEIVHVRHLAAAAGRRQFVGFVETRCIASLQNTG